MHIITEMKQIIPPATPATLPSSDHVEVTKKCTAIKRPKIISGVSVRLEKERVSINKSFIGKRHNMILTAQNKLNS